MKIGLLVASLLLQTIVLFLRKTFSRALNYTENTTQEYLIPVKVLRAFTEGYLRLHSSIQHRKIHELTLTSGGQNLFTNKSMN